MKVYRYWAREAGHATASAGHSMDLAAWGGSDASVEEARGHAREVLASMIVRLQRGESLDHYSYGERALREEIIEEIDDARGRRVGLITRNGYGSLVLNTTNVMFIDIDQPQSVGGGLKRMFAAFRGKQREASDDGLDEVRRIVGPRPELNLRVYRTFKGLRCLVTNDTYEPGGEAAQEILAAFGSDPLYRRLCSAQDCFRARLTPKHWRLGLRAPRDRFPWATPEREAGFRQWQAEYEQAIRGHAACEFIDSVGSGRVRFEVEPIVALHDRHACSPGLPLA